MIKQLVFTLLFLTSFYVLNTKISKSISQKNAKHILLPVKKAPILSSGYKKMMSTLLWIDVIQNSSTNKDPYPYEFNRALFISKLSPEFYFNYQYNSQIISIVRDQFANSNKLLLEGLLFFPMDYDLNYQAGFNHYFLLKNHNVGLNFFEHIYKNKLYHEKNKMFPYIYAKAKMKAGSKELNEMVIQRMYDQAENKILKNALKNLLNNFSEPQ